MSTQAACGDPMCPGEGASLRSLVLASRSPRRRKLLEQHGWEHVAIDPGVDDAALQHTKAPPRFWVAGLSYLKALGGRSRLDPVTASDSLVLGADTVVVKDGRVIGQPTDRTDAERIICGLENGSHEVITGFTLLSPNERLIAVDSARVTVGELDRDALQDYLEGGGWQGKAGGYNLIERIDAGWPITWEGDPGCVMGLPMAMLGPLLLERLVARPSDWRDPS